MKKKILTLVVCVAMVVSSLAGCSSKGETNSKTDEKKSAAVTGAADTTEGSKSKSSEKSGDEPYVIWVNPLVGSAVFTQADEGITAASKEFGFKLKIIGPSVLDDTQMMQAVDGAIVENPDLIVTTPYNYTALEQSYKKAKEKGIPIINISSDSTEDGRVSYIGTNNTAYGQMAADYVNERKNGKANVLIMMANLDTSNQLEQKTAFEEKCKAEYPGIKIVTTEEDNGDATTAIQKFKDLLKAHPEIDTILCLEALGGSSAAVVLKEMDLVGKVDILAIDDNEDTLQYIRDDIIWATMAQNFYKMGYTAGEFASKYLKGEKVDSIVDSGTILITKDNVDTYKDEFSK